jgi:chondroitin synthase
MSTNLKELLRRKESFGSLGAIDFLIDYYQRKIPKSGYSIGYTPFECIPIPVGQDLTKFRTPPANFPKSLVLPEITGLGNNYTPLLNELENSTLNCTVKVSVVILTYNRSGPLSKTLAGLVRQSYPRQLIEVIVTDDGSSQSTIDVVKEYESLLDIKYVWHRDVGFTAAAARNNGVRIARNDFIILLDVDMFPSSTLIENYVKYHRVIDRGVLVGPRKYIDINRMSSADIRHASDLEKSFREILTNNLVAGQVKGNHSVDWRLDVFDKTDNLKTEKVPYRVFASGNVAFSRESFHTVGGFEERFTSWGFEDTELGFRFYNNGFYIIPVLDALAYHQEPEGGENETDRVAGKDKSGELFGQLSPHYRKLTSKNSAYEVPKVSIYIPAYNAEKTICDAVHSVLNQTFKDIEVCICDDGSTDGTLSTLERYFSNDPRVRWVHQENGGIGRASNSALQMCKGIYVGQLDSDDYLATDVVAKCVAELDKDPELGLVYTSYENENSDGTIVPGYNYPVFTREKMMTAMITHHFRFFRKLYWHRTTGFNEAIKNAVDYDMYLKLTERCPAKHLNIVGYRRRLHGENTSIKNFAEQMKNTAVVVNRSAIRQGIPFRAKLESEQGSKLIFESTTPKL